MKQSIFPLLSALLFVAFSCSDPTEKRDYGRWDEDQNAGLDEREFTSAWGESGYYARWDINEDGYLDESEWHSAKNDFLGDHQGAFAPDSSFSEWDADGDNRLSEEEFRRGVFAHYDGDDDMMISEQEYDIWYTPGTERE